MPPSRLITLMCLGTLLLTSLACGISFGDPAEIVPPAIQTAEEAARVAGEAAQTAAAQAGDLSGTAAAVATSEGSEALATIRAAATPHVDYLKEKLASIEPDEDGYYRATLTEEEVNVVLRLRQVVTGDILGAAIQSQEVSFEEGTITLSGTILEPLPGELLVSMRPSIEDGQLQLDIEESSVAGRKAPPQVLDAAEEAINSTLGDGLEHLPAGVQLQELTVADGQLTIVGRRANTE
ncbi:MAG: LmeA family phospholipid-binding protein [Chloroflexota bacterium]